MPVRASDDESTSEDISETTVWILISFGAFFAAAAAIIFLKLLKRLFRRKRPPLNGHTGHSEKSSPQRAEAPSDSSPPSQSSREQAATGKQGISLKHLVKQSKRSGTTHAAQDAPHDHPLYLNALKGFTDAVSGLAFSPDGLHLATACEDRALRVMRIEDVAAKTFAVKRRTLTRDPIDVAFGTSSEIFVLTKGGLDSAVLEKYTFSPDGRGEPLQPDWERKDVHGRQAGKGLQGAVTRHGRGLVMSFSDTTDLRVYDSTGQQLGSINSAGLKNHGAAISADARFLGAATFTSDVRLHEVQFGRDGDFRAVQKVMDLKKAHNGQVYALAFSTDGSRAVTSSKDGSWAVWNLNVRYHLDEDPKVLIRRDQETDGEKYGLLAVGPGGIVAAVTGTALHFLDAGGTGNVLEVVEAAHEGPITALEWRPSPVGRGGSGSAVLATSSADRRVRLWRAPLV